MGVNISGKGILSGIASFIVGAVNNFNLLVTKIIGYTTGGGGGSSYYTVMTGSSANRWIAVKPGMNVVTLYYSDDNLLTVNSNTTSLPQTGFWAVNVNSPILNKYHVYGFTWDSPELFSSDGLTWEAISPNADLAHPSETNNIRQITLNGQEVAVCVVYDPAENKYVLKTSTDFRNWQLLYTPDLINPVDVSFAIDQMQVNGTLKNIIHGRDNREGHAGLYVVTTDDFTTFSEVVIPQGANNIFTYPLPTVSIDKETSTFYFVSINGIYSTQDFITWQTYSLPFSYLTKVTLEIGIVDNTKVFILYGAGSGSNQTYVSTNMNNSWTHVPTINSNWGVKIKNNIAISNDEEELNFKVWENIDQPFALTYVRDPETPYYINKEIVFHNANTLIETQISIGDQGSGGAEILAPVDVYTVPANKTTNINEVRIKNNSGNTITYDLAVLDTGVELTDQNALINDQSILAGATATVTSINTPIIAGQRIVVFPSAVDVVEVKVYGTESNA